MKKIIAVLISAVMLTVSAPTPVNAVDSKEMRDISTTEIVADMGIGINLGNTMESVGDWIKQWSDNSVKAYETAWGSPVVTKEMIQGYADEGFGVLRIPVAWTNRMEDFENYTIDKEYMDRVAQIVDWTLEANMYAIVNIHWDYGWVSDFPTKYDECMFRFTRYWEQISDYFKDYGDHLMFEAQNEEFGWSEVWNPWGGTDGKAEAYDMVNDINQKFVDVVRASDGNNPQRHLLISGYNTDVGMTCDPLFKMPSDPANRMAISVHYYTPATFCILDEDADWGKASPTWGTDAEVAELNRLMDLMKTTFADNGIPVIIGEYGCTTKNKEPDSVHRYISSVCEAAYSRNMCPVLWDTTGGMYDRDNYCMSDEVIKKSFAEIVGDNIPANKKEPVENPITTTIPHTTVSTTSVVSPTATLFGDANCDGKVSIADATAILQAIGNPDKYGLSEQGAINADINGEVGITADDAIIIKKIDAKLISSDDIIASVA